MGRSSARVDGKTSKLGATGTPHVLTCYISRKHFPAPGIDISVSGATYSSSHRKLAMYVPTGMYKRGVTNVFFNVLSAQQTLPQSI